MFIADPTARLGEQIAAKYLEKLGFKIIEKNFRKGYGEIDLIAIENNTLVFVEVKTRTSKKFGTAFEAITPYKIKSLEKTALFYKKLHPSLPEGLRIDAIAIELDSLGNTSNIEHIKNIYD